MKRFLIVLAACLLARASSAHTLQVEPVIVEIRPQKNIFTVEMKGNGEDIIQAVRVRDAERVGSSFTPDTIGRLHDYINQKLQLTQGGKTLHGEIAHLNYWRPDNVDYTKSKFDLILHYERDAKLAAGKFKVTTHLFDYLPNAETILSLGGVQKRMAQGQTIEYDPAAVTANLLGNIRDFMVLGAEHIFTGPDHILFILALLLVSTSFVSLVKTLSGFTLAHSLTLILATLGVVTPPARIVDVVVALSIVYVGLENVFRPNLNHRFWVASAFGLIHGFAFAGNLRDIGLPEEGLIWCLLSFNLGVESGQIIICAITFPILVALRRKFQAQEQYGGMGWAQAVTMASWGVVAAGGYWMAERLIGA